MSQTQLNIGKCKIVFQGTQSGIENFCEYILTKYSLTLTKYYESYLDYVSSELSYMFVIIDDKVFEVVENTSYYGEEIMEANYENGYYDFTLQYHNGGCSFSEALTEALTEAIKTSDGE